MTFTASTLLPDTQCKLFAPADDNQLEGNHDLQVVIGGPLPPLVAAIPPTSLVVVIEDDEAGPGCKI